MVDVAKVERLHGMVFGKEGGAAPGILGADLPHTHGGASTPCFFTDGTVVRAYRIEHCEQYKRSECLYETAPTAILALHELVTTERRAEMADRATGEITWPYDPAWIVPMSNGGSGYRLVMHLFTCQPLVDTINEVMHTDQCQWEETCYQWALTEPDYWRTDANGTRVRPQRCLRLMPPTIDQAVESHPLWRCWQDRLAYQRLVPFFLT